MTVSSTSSRVNYIGAGSTGPYSFSFRIQRASDLTVTVTTSTGVAATLVLNSDYTVAGAGARNGGSITLTTALPVGSTLTIRRVVSVTQPTNIRNQGPYFPETVEDALDRVVYIAQQLSEVNARTMTLPVVADPAVVSAVLPVPVANKVLAWNSSATALTTTTIDTAGIGVPAGGRTVATATAYLANNAVFNVKDFGAVGDGATNDTVAIQNAINTGGDVYFPAGNYRCVGLTSGNNSQTFYANSGGKTYLSKNGNGVIFTGSGYNQQIINLRFDGLAASGYTGHNVVMTGDYPAFINSGSRNAAGRAIKATGGGVQIAGGRSDVYQTADATGSGYDIEIGVLGTTTGYHQLHGVVTSQATGGILFNDTGSHSLMGGQCGKITMVAGGGGATNAGMTSGVRILGAVTVGLSGGIFTGNQFGAIAITLGAGTTGILLDTSNSFQAGHTVSNLGNGDGNLIMRNVGTGSTGTIIRFGDDANYVDMTLYRGAAGVGGMRMPYVQIKNSKNLYMEQATVPETVGAQLGMSAADNLTLWNQVTDKGIVVLSTGPNSLHVHLVDGVAALRLAKTYTELPLALKHTGTTAGFYNVAPVTRAGAISAPSAPSAAYSQTEAQSMKTAVDAIRVALANIGITS